MPKEILVTYLIGAGASANALPIVKGIPDKLKAFGQAIAALTKEVAFDGQYFNALKKKTKSAYAQDMIEDVMWLAGEARRHASIDTYAKKLYLGGFDTLLRKLKTVLSVFLLWEQQGDTIDQRYDTLFASICDKEDAHAKLPEHLRVISWNYDFQFEKAFKGYSFKDTLLANQEYLNVTPRPGKKIEMNPGFGLVKLNGSPMVVDSSSGLKLMLEHLDYGQNIGLVETLVWIHASVMEYDSVLPMLNFAWEKDEVQDKVLVMTKLATVDTSHLVVIGYSFPFFNREIDREIITNMHALERVYIQAPSDDADKIIESFKSIKPDFGKDLVVPIRDVSQFFLPPEL